jgi:hypothetical protein
MPLNASLRCRSASRLGKPEQANGETGFATSASCLPSGFLHTHKVGCFCTWFSRPGGYFCPVLAADGKLDCAPK